jgi:hypothetical protein
LPQTFFDNATKLLGKHVTCRDDFSAIDLLVEESLGIETVAKKSSSFLHHFASEAPDLVGQVLGSTLLDPSYQSFDVLADEA